MSLRLITSPTIKEIRLLMKWRKNVQPLWKETFKVTFYSTFLWISKIINNPNRMLFFVMKGKTPIGQIGFDYIGLKQVYIGSVIRGSGKPDGSMSHAVQDLISIAQKNRKFDIFLKVLPSNAHAIEFYKKIGFKKINTVENYLVMQYEKN